jgi:hypothetical protein
LLLAALNRLHDYNSTAFEKRQHFFSKKIYFFFSPEIKKAGIFLPAFFRLIPLQGKRSGSEVSLSVRPRP